MNSHDLNKFAMGTLIAVLGVIGFNLLSEEIFHQAPLEANAYPIDTSAVASASVADVAVEEGPSIAELLQTADMEKGMSVFRKCAACHTTASGDRNKIGPNLWNIVGRDVATNDTFGYSDAMLAQEGGWSFDLLDRYLTKPKDAIPGNKMVFAGLKKGSDRASVILYLRSLSEAPMELPTMAALEDVVEEDIDAATEAAPEAM